MSSDNANSFVRPFFLKIGLWGNILLRLECYSIFFFWVDSLFVGAVLRGTMGTVPYDSKRRFRYKNKKKKIKRKKQDTESSELDIGNDSRVDEYLCRDAVRESFCECSEHVFLTSCAETTNQSGQIIAVVFGVVLLGKRTYKKQQQTLTSAFSRRYI